MCLDAAFHVRTRLQVRVLVVNDAVHIARTVFASLGALAGIPVAHHAIFARQASLPHLRAGDNAVDHILQAGQTALAHLHQRRTAITGVRVVVVCCAVARLTEVTAHSADRHEQLRQVLRTVAASGGEVMQHPHVVLHADFACKPGDFLHRHTANLGSPRGVVLHAVILAFQVVQEVHVFLQVGWLVIGIEAHRVFIQEVPIDDATLGLVEAHHLRRNAQQKRGVSTRANRNPLGIQHLGRRGVNGVDGDELHTGFLSANVVIAWRTSGRPCGIRSVEHDCVGIQHVGTIVAYASVGSRNTDSVSSVQKIGTMRSGISRVQMAAPCQKRGKSQTRAVAAQQKCTVAVLFLDGLELVANILDGLVPANALPLITAAQVAVGVFRGPVLALQGVLDTVSAEALLLLSLTTHAAALLRVIERVLMRIVSLLTHHGAVFDHDLVHAAAAAVVPACRRYPLAVFRRVDGQLMLIDGLKA